MLDFLRMSARPGKNGTVDIGPRFVVGKSDDLMIRGRDFYAFWNATAGEWCTDESVLIKMVDQETDNYAAEYQAKHPDAKLKLHYMWDSSSRIISQWHMYCQKDMRDNFKNLDENITFANDVTTKESYSSKRLPYPLQEGPYDAYDRLMSVLYSPAEREKIEWAVGSIITGDSKKIQKFLVLYGSAGTGKSTVLNIIQKLFEGYYSTFDSRALGSSSDSFALEAFKDNPLIAIQHDGDLSRIEDNTRLNSLVSHETMRVNEKFRPTYSNKFISFLFMGTNKPVKITDAKSGLIRRLIDVTPTGNKVSAKEYKDLMKRIGFELGGIAWHCRDVYLSDPGKYDNYIPVNMMGASNDFFNFVQDQYFNFEKEDEVTLGVAYERYDQYCKMAKVLYPMSRRAFAEELKNYFREFKDRATLENGSRIRSLYSGFKKNLFEYPESDKEEDSAAKLILRKKKSILDQLLAECLAQYATDEGIPENKWKNVKTTLSDLDTSRLHYVKVPTNHIVIDFDLKNEAGEKSRERNLEEAAKWPPTYAEYSKGGSGVHLHYIYDGDVSLLDPIYSKDIEVKVFKGNSSLRRKLTLCNDLEVAHISSGLPLKEVKEKTISEKRIKSEQSLRKLIARHMRKEIMHYTKPSIDMIKKILDDCYADDIVYDITDMADALIEFALSSTHNAEACLKIVNEMKLSSEPIMPKPVEEDPDPEPDPLIFFDIEVYPNLFLVCWKYAGEGRRCVRMFNPTSEEIQTLSNNRLVGFNCRRYDNHICYGRILGETNEQLFNRSQAIINGDKNAFFGGAYDFSYTDVYDFSSKKQSLKKFEIDLGIHHQEMGIPWDQPVPEEMWDKVADYCCNDVYATEETFNARQADFIAREILADVAGMTVNDTTNSLTTKIIFEGNKHPQSEFNYRDMGNILEIDPITTGDLFNTIDGLDEKYTFFDMYGRPIFPDYLYKSGKSTYRGEEVGEGGYVYSEPGMYGNVALLDIASMHPSSIIAEKLFGERFTKRFQEIVEARIAIKHKDFEAAKNMLGGVLSKYLDDPDKAKALAQALKIAINSVYGLTAAHFDNPFRDRRNKDNIVAKRGALFMVNLKHEVQKRGFTVAHIKTDSIKIPDATPEIIQFVMDYGKLYGYTFEHEDTYERMCLVNDAVYIAKSKDGHWSATGTQFAVPYVFKSLFTHEQIVFSDLCETKSVSGGSSIYLDMNEGLPDDTELVKEREKLYKQLGEELIRVGSEMLEGLDMDIAACHNYIFVGRVGLFTPIKAGCGGGELYREKDGKYFAVTGTKGYRWLESEMVMELSKQSSIDYDYYDRLVDEAVETIRKYSMIEDERHGVKDWFFSDVPYKEPEYKDGIPLHYYNFE